MRTPGCCSSDGFGGGDQKASGAAGRVADLVRRLWRGHVHHQLDDVPWGAELAVDARRGDLGQQVLVEVAAGVAVGHRDVVEHVHHPRQQLRGGDGEPGVLHVHGIGGPVAAERAQEREHLVGDRLVHDRRLVVLEPRPAQVLLIRSEDDALTLPGAVGLLLGQGVEVVQAPDEQQVGDLLDDLQRVGDAAGPEGVPNAVDLALQLTGDHSFGPLPVVFRIEQNCIYEAADIVGGVAHVRLDRDGLGVNAPAPAETGAIAP